MSETIRRIEPVADEATMAGMIIDIAHQLDGLAAISPGRKEDCVQLGTRHETIDVFREKLEQTGPAEPGTLVTTLETRYGAARNTQGLNEGYGVSLYYADESGARLYTNEYLLRVRTDGVGARNGAVLSALMGLDIRLHKFMSRIYPNEPRPGLRQAGVLEALWLRTEIERLRNIQGRDGESQIRPEVI